MEGHALRFRHGRERPEAAVRLLYDGNFAAVLGYILRRACWLVALFLRGRARARSPRRAGARRRTRPGSRSRPVGPDPAGAAEAAPRRPGAADAGRPWCTRTS